MCGTADTLCMCHGVVIHQHEYTTQRVRHCIDHVAIEIFCFSASANVWKWNDQMLCFHIIHVNVLQCSMREWKRERDEQRWMKKEKKKEISASSQHFCPADIVWALTKQHNIISYLPTVNSQWEIRLVIRLLVCCQHSKADFRIFKAAVCR